MEIIKKVLRYYNLLPKKVEKITSKVYKITDSQREYALKKTNFTNSQVYNWLNLYSNQQLLKHIIPLYLTRDNKLTVTVEGKDYYLSPWINDPLEVSTLEAHKLLEEIHLIDLEKREVKGKGFSEKVAIYEKKLYERKAKAMQTIELFEQSHYMSPVELQYCTHFHKLQESFFLIEQELKGIKEYKEGSLEWNIGLTHGNFIKDHILKTAENKLTINWEKATYNYLIYDLITFYENESKYTLEAKDSIFKGFLEYTKTIKLKPYEKSLIFIFLLDTSKYFRSLFSHTPMLEKVKLVEKEFRVIQLGLYLVRNYSHSK